MLGRSSQELCAAQSRRLSADMAPPARLRKLTNHIRTAAADTGVATELVYPDAALRRE